jgi:hypothetical protein
MAIKSAPYHWLECDGCGGRHEPGGGEYSAMADATYVIDEAVDEDDWTTDGQRHHCPTCPGLYRCEECGEPAGEMAGEREYRCLPCWESALAEVADMIEDGTLTPWADTPQPAAAPPTAAEVAAAIQAGNVVCMQTIDRDMQAFAELPDCEACGGTGKAVPEGWYDAPEPAAAPAERVQEPPAAADASPGTPQAGQDAHGVLGRALLDDDGALWWPDEDGTWRSGSSYMDRVPHSREVLLVDPATWQHMAAVVQAAQAWRTADRDPARHSPLRPLGRWWRRLLAALAGRTHG